MLFFFVAFASHESTAQTPSGAEFAFGRYKGKMRAPTAQIFYKKNRATRHDIFPWLRG